MAKSTILVSLGSGADDRATSGKISVRRVREGADGDVLVLSAWKDYSVTEGLQLDVTVGELYESRELEPRGRTRYWYAPATTTTYADLEDVFPLPPGEDYGPQGVGVVDAIQPEAGKVAFNLTDGSTTTPIDLPPGEPGPNNVPTDTFMASKADDPTSEFAASLSAKIEAVKDEAVPVDLVKYKVRLSLGQSNTMTGGTQLAQVDTADPRIWCWPTVGSLIGNLIQAIDPLPSFSTLAGHIGHVMTSSKLRVRQLPPNYQAVIIPVHRGATGFTNSVGLYTWDPDNTDPTLTNLYNQAVAFCQSFIAYCNAYGYSYEFDVITWAQGEQDADTLDQAAYAAKLKRLFEKLEIDVPQLAGVPKVITGMRQAWITSHPSAANIRAAHVDMARQLTHVAYVDGPPDDGQGTPDGIVHYNATEQRALGVREWKARDYAMANVLGVAPLVPHTPVVTQSATSVTITWGHDPGRVTDYAVRWRKNGGSWTTLASIPSVDRARTVTGLTAGDVVDAQVAAINEQGQSAWSTTGSFTLVPPPGQVTGLSLGTATQHTQPLSWPAVSQATSYLVEYKAASSGSWLTFGTTTGLTSTVTGLSAAVSYNYRVSAANTGGQGSASSTSTGSTAAPLPLVDDVAVTALEAYGLRKQRTAWSGSAVKIRRSSDNTTADIGFLSTGEWDAATALTFVGANNGFVDTIYDQSGNGRHLVNTTAAQQPKIINAGSLITKNGRAAIQFAAAGALTGSFSGLWSAGSSTQMTVYASTGASQGILSSEGSASGSNARFYIGFINGAAQFSTGSIADTGATSAVAQVGALSDGTLRQITAKETGTAMQLYVAGALAVTSALYDHTAPATLARRSIGGASVGGTVASLFTGFWSEHVSFASALDDASRSRGEQNQREFYTI